MKTYTQNLEKKKMIYLCRHQWPQYPLIDPEFPYYWDPDRETSKYWMNKLKDYIIKHKMKEQLPYLEVWYHVRFEGPVPPAMEVKQFVTKEDESETEEWMGRPPARELAQLNKDLENLPLGGTRTNPASAFPVREVANGTNAQGNPVTVFVAVPIKPTELRELKKTLPKLHENVHEVAEQLELFLGPSEYTYPELMYILGHLFTPEERNLIRRAAMAAWDRRQAGQQGAVAANVKFPIADPNWDLNNAGHREHMRDMKRMILEGIKLAIPQGKI
ncbi:hypothetical protein E2320_009129 [Naja naja]|nr:hypothetical protein E2320_009129 [Naja naja]